MPYRVEKIKPIDLNERKAIGVKIPFSSPSVFTQTFVSIDAYKANIINYLSTAKGDRYFNPMFGNTLLNSLFEHYTETSRKSIEKELKVELGYYFPDLNIDELTLEATDEFNAFQLHIEFSLKNSNQKDEVTINFG